MNIGKLYQLKQYYWLLYPSKETAAEAVADAAWTLYVAEVATESLSSAPDDADDDDAAYWSDYWSNQLNCDVSFISPKTILFPIEIDGKFLKILSTNGEIGWMIYPTNQDWTKDCIEEVTL